MSSYGPVGVGTDAAVWRTQSIPPPQAASKTTVQPPHEPSIGAAQLVGHWQQSLAAGVLVGVGVSAGVAVAAGVDVAHDPPMHDAPNTTEHPPHVPSTGAAQKSAHWQQSRAPGVGCTGQPITALSTERMISAIVTSAPFGMPDEHVDGWALPRAMFTNMMASATVTMPFASQSPTHTGDIDIGVGVGVGVGTSARAVCALTSRSRAHISAVDPQGPDARVKKPTAARCIFSLPRLVLLRRIVGDLVARCQWRRTADQLGLCMFQNCPG